METEGIQIEFSDEAICKIAEVAFEVNQNTDNIGARRLHTILEKLLEDLSFEAPEITMDKVTLHLSMWKKSLVLLSRNKDLSQFIL